MKAITAILTLYFCALLCANAGAQRLPDNRIQHSQTMHQYIVAEAYKLLQRLDPVAAKKLEKHMDSEGLPLNTGSTPWDAKTILAGAWREDAEDVVYGYGSANKEQWPDIDMSRKDYWSDGMYSELEKSLKNDPGFAEGLTTCTHFWDASSSNRYLIKSGIVINGTGIFDVMDDDNQILTIKPQWTAWDKAQRIIRPNWTVAIRDKWWEQGGKYRYNNNSSEALLPQQTHASQEIAISYESLAHLYNTGACYLSIPGIDNSSMFTLTTEQRNRYVWEMLGRVCHLLADMSVPAHTHRDIHMGNLDLYSDQGSWGSISITIRDQDSYENWIASPHRAYWNANNIQGGLLDLSNHPDPLFFIFNSTRERAASFASDDVDGYGPYAGAPRTVAEMLDRYNPSTWYTPAKTMQMETIRDHTLPYAIRATATLLAWFAHQLSMPETFVVRNTGADGYSDFFNRDRFNVHFPDWGTTSGTPFNEEVGDPLSLRSHYLMHRDTQAKFSSWKYAQQFKSELHQYDARVDENQPDVNCFYRHSERYIVPTIQIMGELGQPLTSDYPSFRDPWHVDPSKCTQWDIHQPGIFDRYQPYETTTSNGGIFLNNYDQDEPLLPHYSIRASKIWDKSTLAHKWPTPEIGDYIFQEWEAIYSELYDDALNALQPQHHAFLNPEQYDTRAVNFLQNTAIVNAHVKTHRTSVGQIAPSNSNSQRKVALAQDGSYHAVYESNGRIWYISSTDKGASWSPEIAVTEAGVHATRPSIAAIASSAYISCLVDGQVQLRMYEYGEWKPIYTAPVNMVGDATPVLAILRDEPRSVDHAVISALVWEDYNVLKFAVIANRNPIVDNQVMVYGAQRANSVDQPRFPSIAASVLPVTSANPTQAFHVAWIENGSIFHSQINIDRMQKTPAIIGWTAGGTFAKEVVHARTGSAGLSYPAKHAPSIAVDDLGHVHVAFDVVSWHSPSPTTSPTAGGTSGSPANMFALRERPNTLAHTGGWNTTATVVSASNPGQALTAPTVGTRPAMAPTPKSSKSSSLRITYNDRIGGLRTVKLDHALGNEYHADGLDPNMTVWSGKADGLLDVFSLPAAQPYDWHLHSSQNHLTKADTRVPARMREIILSKDEGFSVFGIADLRVSDGTDRGMSVDWNPEHDSLQIGFNATVAGKMRSDRIPTADGGSLRFRIERYATGITDAAVSFIIRLRDAVTGELLRLLDFPADEQDTMARLEAKTIDLSAFNGRDVVLEADVLGLGDGHRVDIADRYAMVDPAEYEATLEQDIVVEGAAPITLRNSPNPFNPSTVIRFSLPADAPVRLAVYDLLGREVNVLVNGRLDAGDHQVRFDGGSLPSGVYLYQLTVGGRSLTRSMHLVK
ncbi:MAG: T9SS type A sorting domain-containing protein [Bacteroidia bacterium]|nr:T9SS type A sorting domain-containing protein [Bacteroidia bacterium]